MYKVEDRLEVFKRNNKEASGYIAPGDYFSNISSLDNERTKFLLTAKYIDYVEKYITESNEYDKIITPNTVNVENKVLDQLIGELIQLQLEKNTYLGGATNRNPFLNEVNIKIENLKKSLLEAIATSRATNALALQNIESQMKMAEKSVGALPTKEREFVGINRLYTINENIYLVLLQKRLEADLVRAAATVDSRVVNPAMLEKKLGPETRKNYLIGLFAGLLLPIVLIYLIEFFRGTIENTDELERISKIPVLASVLHTENKEGKSTIILDKPKSALAESFRALRSNLNFVLGNNDDSNKVILVTSSIPGEGKSFCSINISLVLALSGKKVIHIAADMRKPKLYVDLAAGAVDTGQGLSTYLSQLAELDQIITPSVAPMLDVIPSGPVPPNPSELLLNKRMDVLITELKKRYDMIVIDTPPIGLVSDPMNLMKYSDANLYVVRYKYTPAERIKYINKLYTDGQVGNLNFIFNDVKHRTRAYGYGYGYGYGYYDDSLDQVPFWKRISRWILGR